jgi:endonuclease/exonuclease/phosphatase family metal-dependent hydrolase
MQRPFPDTRPRFTGSRKNTTSVPIADCRGSYPLKQIARELALTQPAQPFDLQPSQPESSRQAGSEIKLASYNIHLGIGRDGEFRPARIAAVIDEIGADVIALQEISLGAPSFNMLRYLGDACCLTAIGGPTLITASGQYGNAMLTGLAHEEVHHWDLSRARCEPRAALEARFSHGSHTFRAIATHLGLRPAERRDQIRTLLKIIENDRAHPTVLMGDVNEWFLWGRPLRWMHRHFQATPALATFPAGRPLFALDRIWVEPRRALKKIEVHVSENARMASDHLPIVATLDCSAFEHLPPAGDLQFGNID